MGASLLRAFSLAAALLAATAVAAGAQGTDVGVSGVGLLSIQLVDEAYVGSPYLSEGIGGLAPGFGAGVSIITSSGFVVAGELTTARFTQEQSGRLVEGCTGTSPCVDHTTKLHDSLLSGLVGYAWSGGNTRVMILGGASAKLDEPTIDGEPREPFEVGDEPFPFVPTGGVDVLQSLNSRTALIVGARYSFIDRAENHQYLGIGPHVLRIAAGIRVRLN